MRVLLSIIIVLLLNSQINMSNLKNNMNKDEVVEMDSEFRGVWGAIASYEHIERSLEKSDFADIEIGEDISAVRERIGKPNGIAGSGLSDPYYELNSGQYILIRCAWQDYGKVGKVSGVYLVDGKNCLEVIKE